VKYSSQFSQFTSTTISAYRTARYLVRFLHSSPANIDAVGPSSLLTLHTTQLYGSVVARRRNRHVRCLRRLYNADERPQAAGFQPHATRHTLLTSRIDDEVGWSDGCERSHRDGQLAVCDSTIEHCLLWYVMSFCYLCQTPL